MTPPARTWMRRMRHTAVMVVANLSAAYSVFATEGSRVACTDLQTHGDQAAIICAGGDIHVTIEDDGRMYERVVPWSEVEQLLRKLKAEHVGQPLTEVEVHHLLREGVLAEVRRDVSVQKRWHTASAISVAAAGIGLLATLAWVFAAHSSDQKSSGHCTDNVCDATGEDHRRRALSQASAADATAAVTALLGVAGLAGLYVFDPDSLPAPASAGAATAHRHGLILGFSSTW